MKMKNLDTDVQSQAYEVSGLLQRKMTILLARTCTTVMRMLVVKCVHLGTKKIQAEATESQSIRRNDQDSMAMIHCRDNC